MRIILFTLGFGGLLLLALTDLFTTGLFAFSQPMADGYLIGFAAVVSLAFLWSRLTQKGTRR